MNYATPELNGTGDRVRSLTGRSGKSVDVHLRGLQQTLFFGFVAMPSGLF
jgi:hypothetical protein